MRRSFSLLEAVVTIAFVGILALAMDKIDEWIS